MRRARSMRPKRCAPARADGRTIREGAGRRKTSGGLASVPIPGLGVRKSGGHEVGEGVYQAPNARAATYATSRRGARKLTVERRTTWSRWLKARVRVVTTP